MVLERHILFQWSVYQYTKQQMCSPVLNVVQFMYRLKRMAGKEKDFAALDPAKKYAWKYFVG